MIRMKRRNKAFFLTARDVSATYIQSFPHSHIHPFHHPPTLLRRTGESLRKLGLPAQPILAEDLRIDLELLPALQQGGPNDNLVAHDGLVVVKVGSAVGTVVAVDGVS